MNELLQALTNGQQDTFSGVPEVTVLFICVAVLMSVVGVMATSMRR